MNVQQLMKQAQQMQEKLQKQMESIVVEATSGGGMVSVKMNGQKQLLSIQIDPEV
jgi:DNA-binding YbaB/EbfC family protein